MSDTFAVAKCPKLRKISEQNLLEQKMLKYLRKFLGYPLGEMIDYPPPWVVLLLENGLDELVIRDILFIS